MNNSAQKVLRDCVAQLGLYLGLAILLGLNEGWWTALQFMGLIVLAQLLSSPITYAYYQYKERREAKELADLKNWRAAFIERAKAREQTLSVTEQNSATS